MVTWLVVIHPPKPVVGWRVVSSTKSVALHPLLPCPTSAKCGGNVVLLLTLALACGPPGAAWTWTSDCDYTMPKNHHHPAHTCAETAGAPYKNDVQICAASTNQPINRSERQQPSSLKSQVISRRLAAWCETHGILGAKLLDARHPVNATTLDGACHGENFSQLKSHISSMVIPAMQDKHWADLIAKSESSHLFEKFFSSPTEFLGHFVTAVLIHLVYLAEQTKSKTVWP